MSDKLKKRSNDMLTIFMIALISGMMFSFTHGTINMWFSVAGIPKSKIGFMHIATFPFALKFLWSGFFDIIIVKFFKKFNNYYRWTVVFQILIFICISIYFFINPTKSLFFIFIFQFFLSILAASHDANSDAYRVKILSSKEQGLGTSFAISGYRIGMYLAGGIFLLLVSYLCDVNLLCDNITNWQYSYLIFSILIFTIMVMIFFIRRNSKDFYDRNFSENKGEKKYDNFLGHIEHFLRTSFISPIKDFYSRESMCILILFSLLFARAPDIFIGVMLNPFFLEMGYSIRDIAFVNKTFGFFITFVGAYFGGFLLLRFNLNKMVIIGLFLQMISNLSFMLIYYIGNYIQLLFLAIAVENITGGMITTIFVAYISNLCKNSNYIALQYSMLTSFTALGVLIISPISGILAELLNWDSFFLISALIGIIPLFTMLHIFSNKINTTTEIA
ncbi:AmpG family muropeptide MFS transporter [Anaplasmataceae bacterium AB001_6]|nr:AmpG family muropeptide MFS transporter [Anaplasmataceae bacterium AB001_6]